MKCLSAVVHVDQAWNAFRRKFYIIASFLALDFRFVTYCEFVPACTACAGCLFSSRLRRDSPRLVTRHVARWTTRCFCVPVPSYLCGCGHDTNSIRHASPSPLVEVLRSIGNAVLNSRVHFGVRCEWLTPSLPIPFPSALDHISCSCRWQCCAYCVFFNWRAERDPSPRCTNSRPIRTCFLRPSPHALSISQAGCLLRYRPGQHTFRCFPHHPCFDSSSLEKH